MISGSVIPSKPVKMVRRTSSVPERAEERLLRRILGKRRIAEHATRGGIRHGLGRLHDVAISLEVGGLRPDEELAKKVHGGPHR